MPDPARELIAVYVYESFPVFIPGPGWTRCHKISFSCLTGQYEISQHHLFGKTNEKEIKFITGLCASDTLLCIESDYDIETQMLSLFLAETDNSEPWPDAIIDALQPKKAIDEFSPPLECQFIHTEWDETMYWCHDEDTRKVDFLGWISTHAW